MGDSLFHSIWRMRTTRAARNSQDTHPYKSFFPIFPDFKRV